MTDQTDFLKEAVAAMAHSDIDAFDGVLDNSEQWRRTAQTLALLSLAQDMRRIADALESVASDSEFASVVRIWGSAS